MKITLQYFILVIILSSCSMLNSKHVSDEVVDYKEITEKLFTDNISYIYNKGGEKIICKGNKSRLQSSFSFFVYSKEDKKMLTDVIGNVEQIEWVDGSTLRYKLLPGTVQKNDETTKFKYLKLND